MRVARAGVAAAVVGIMAVTVALTGGERSAAATSGAHAVALVDAGGQWHLRSPEGTTTSFYFGNPGDRPIMGRWHGGPEATVGMYRPSDGFFYSRDSNTQGIADSECFAGDEGDQPLAGDWDGDGVDTLGLYRAANQTFYLFNEPCANAPMGAADVAFVFGDAGDAPFAGDLDGDGITEVALHRPSTGLVYYRETLTTGIAHRSFVWGDPQDVVFAGDWDGDGIDTVGLFRGADSTFYLRNTNSAGNAHESFEIKPAAGHPASGATGIPVPPFPGPPGDLAVNHIPDVDIPDPPAADLVAPAGIPISTRDLVVVLDPAATVAEVTDLLASLQAEVVAGDPGTALVLLRLAGPTDLTRVLAGQTLALDHAAVAAASINVALEDEQLPRFVVDTTNNRWTWEVPPTAASGNWGLKTIRMPAAWNLLDHAVRANATIDALIMDASATAAADTHPDLSPRIVKFAASDPVGDHDTVMAGIIGARSDNAAGVDGVYPRALTIQSRWATYWGTLATTTTRVLGAWDDVRVVAYSAGSSGRYRKNGIDPVTARVNPAMPPGPNNPTWRTQMNTNGNTFLAAIQAWEGGPLGRSDYLMFCSAGNLRLRPGTMLDYQARDNSPCANVAWRGVGGAGLPGGGARADHFLAVEAMDSTGNRGSRSASAGTLSAPGVCVRSTEANNGTNYDLATCPASDGMNHFYATQSGTSFATPYAAGVAAYVWSLDAALTYTQVRQIVAADANTKEVGAGPMGGAAGSQRIDGFAAVMGVDVLRGNEVLQGALVDVDDGSALDGNARIDHDDEDGDGNTAEPYPFGINRVDGRRGDGEIGMPDFRAFRDALLQTMVVEMVLPAAEVDLDGPAAHFKKDLNFDGCVATAVAAPPHPTVVAPPNCTNGTPENAFARYDFNGDGRLNGRQVDPPAGEVARFKADLDDGCAGLGNPAGCLRDVDILADLDLWTTDVVENVTLGDGAEMPLCGTDSWDPVNFLLKDRDGDDVVDYLLSMDVHFAIGPLDPGYDKVSIRVRSLRAPTPPPEPWLRCIEITGPVLTTQRYILTVPLFDPMRVAVTIVADDVDGILPPKGFIGEKDRRFGEDVLCTFDDATQTCP